MSFRIFEGNVLSLNGWRMCNADECVWRTIPGSNNVSIQVRKGIPETILVRFLERFNQVIEPLRDNDTACWTLTNDVSTSQHPAGVAVDCDWELHPFHAYGTYGDRLPALRHLLDVEFKGCVGWGGDWGGNPQDEMHFEIAFREGYLADPNNNDSFVLDVDPRLIALANEIQASQPATPPAAQVLSGASGLSLDRATQILPTVVSGLQAAECTNVNRIAMWLAQCGEESAGFSTTEEFASGAEYEGRCSDLGNCSPGDGVKYKGRTWIQITGKAHYREFSEWAFGKGLCGSPTQFVDDPASLGDLQWAGIGAAWYWTVSRPDINALSDAGDVVTVTHRINGGENGLADRQNRYSRAVAMGDQLLALITAPTPVAEGFLMALSDQQQQELYDTVCGQRPSLSPFRPLGQGNVGNMRDVLGFIDGSEHFESTEDAARLGHPPSLALLKEVAGADLSRYPDRAADKDLANAVLADIFSAPPAAEDLSALVSALNDAVAKLQSLNIPQPAAPAPAPFYPPAPAPAPVPVPVVNAAPTPAVNGDVAAVIADLYSALDRFGLADALDIKQRAPLSMLSKIIESKNGTQV